MEKPKKITIAYVNDRLKCDLEQMGFQLTKNGWFVLSRPDNVDFCIKAMNVRFHGALSRCDFLVDFVDGRQVALIKKWLDPIKYELVARTTKRLAEREGRKNFEVGSETCTDILKWFEPDLSKYRKTKFFTTYMYCFFIPDELFCSSVGQDSDFVGMKKTWRHYNMKGYGWRMRALYDEEDDAELFEKSLAGMLKCVKKILLPLGKRLSLSDLLDDQNAIRKALVTEDMSRQHVVGRHRSRWLMALDLSAAAVLGRFDCIEPLLRSRSVNLGFHQSDLDEEAYELIVKNARIAAENKTLI